MNDQPVWLQLVVYQVPTAIVALVGVILGFVYLRRAPGAAMLALLGCGLMLVASVTFTGIRAALFEQLREGEIPNKRYAELMATVSMASSTSYAFALALVVAAAFVGRRSTRGAPTDVTEAKHDL
jgi:hypothetical protein